MKRFALLIISLLLLALPLLTLGSCNVGAVPEDSSRYNYLICGFDDVSENTDVIIIASIDTDSGKLDFVQIPRDTVYSSGDEFYKINGIFPKKIAQGLSKDGALRFLRDELSEIFGTDFSGYFGLTTDNLRDTVDLLGGIELYVPESFDESLLSELGLNRGRNTLGGEEVLRLTRHRKSYVTGDLGRVDVQKLVLSALVKKLHGGLNITSMLNMIMELDGVTSDFRIRDALKILEKSRGSLENYDLSFSTLPGEASVDGNGIWYYVANRASSGKLIFELGLSGSQDFDTTGKLMPRGSASFMKLYEKRDLMYRIYYNDDILSINLNTKK